MSKVRERIPEPSDELSCPPEGDLRAYVVFTQLKQDGPFLYAGWLDAADDAMALSFAREHYGQDQACTSIWCVPKDAITGVEPDLRGHESTGDYEAFVSRDRGTGPSSVGAIEAPDAATALRRAREQAEAAGPTAAVWVVPREDIAATSEGDVIWRMTDQSYRLARGYSKLVREKWETVRSQRDLETYERDDLKETF
ncbi:MAG: hypothetical protein ACYTJ0_13895 [Planctomycetota bacterium]|jgi:1,2-phenylacetyl-CoA epoxidase PaaB subunit